MICFLCENEDIGFYFNDSRILKCQKCGVVFLNPELKIKSLKNYYSDGDFWQDVLIDGNCFKTHQKSSGAYLQLITPHLFQSWDKIYLLDIGAHDGIFIEEANHLGCRAVGLEPNKRIVKRAWARGLQLIEGVIENYQPKEKFDVITMFHVLEHLENPLLALKRVHSALKDGGLFVLEVPNIDSYLAKYHGLSWKFIALEHLFYFSPLVLFNLLEKSGFKILTAQKRNFEIAYLGTTNIFQYFRPRILQDHNRFQMKKPKNNYTPPPFYVWLISVVLKKLGIKLVLAKLVEIMQRGDHLFVVARKIPDS